MVVTSKLTIKFQECKYKTKLRNNLKKKQYRYCFLETFNTKQNISEINISGTNNLICIINNWIVIFTSLIFYFD